MTNLGSILKSRDVTLLTKVHLVKAMVLPVVMYGCESWTIKKAEHRRIDAFELQCWIRLLRVPWTARRSNQFNSKGNKTWILIGRTDAEAETLILWPPDVNWLIGKDPDAGKDWRQKEKGMTEDEMDGISWLSGHEFEQAPGVGDGQESLASQSQTQLSNWTELSSEPALRPDQITCQSPDVTILPGKFLVSDTSTKVAPSVFKYLRNTLEHTHHIIIPDSLKTSVGVLPVS